MSPSDFYVSVSNTAGMDKDLRVVVIHIEEMSLQDDIYKAIDLGHVFPNFSTLTIQALQKKLSNQVIFAEIDVKLIDQDDKEITDFSIDDYMRLVYYYHWNFAVEKIFASSTLTMMV